LPTSSGFTSRLFVEREPGSEPSAKELSRTIDMIRKAGSRRCSASRSTRLWPRRRLRKETGAKVYVLDPGVSGPDNPDAYLQIMEKNLEVLRHAFSE